MPDQDNKIALPTGKEFPLPFDPADVFTVLLPGATFLLLARTAALAPEDIPVRDLLNGGDGWLRYPAALAMAFLLGSVFNVAGRLLAHGLLWFSITKGKRHVAHLAVRKNLFQVLGLDSAPSDDVKRRNAIWVWHPVLTAAASQLHNARGFRAARRQLMTECNTVAALVAVALTWPMPIAWKSSSTLVGLAVVSLCVSAFRRATTYWAELLQPVSGVEVPMLQRKIEHEADLKRIRADGELERRVSVRVEEITGELRTRAESAEAEVDLLGRNLATEKQLHTDSELARKNEKAVCDQDGRRKDDRWTALIDDTPGEYFLEALRSAVGKDLEDELSHQRELELANERHEADPLQLEIRVSCAYATEREQELNRAMNADPPSGIDQKVKMRAGRAEALKRARERAKNRKLAEGPIAKFKAAPATRDK